MDEQAAAEHIARAVGDQVKQCRADQIRSRRLGTAVETLLCGLAVLAIAAAFNAWYAQGQMLKTNEAHERRLSVIESGDVLVQLAGAQEKLRKVDATSEKAQANGEAILRVEGRLDVQATKLDGLKDDVAEVKTAVDKVADLLTDYLTAAARSPRAPATP